MRTEGGQLGMGSLRREVRQRVAHAATVGMTLSGLVLASISCGATGAGKTADTTSERVEGEKVRSGPIAPDFSLPALSGDLVRLSDYLGRKVILIDFWSTTCDPCLQAMPELVALYDKHKDGGFVVLAVSVDGPESLAQVRSVVHDRKMRFPVLLDEETDVMARYNPKRELPFTVVIDKGGTIVHKRAGHQGHGSMEALIQAVEDALVAG